MMPTENRPSIILSDEKLDHLADTYVAMAKRNPLGWSVPTFDQFLWLVHQQATQELLLDYAAISYMAEMKNEAQAR